MAGPRSSPWTPTRDHVEVVLANVNIIDVANGTIREGVHLRLSKGKIAKITKTPDSGSSVASLDLTGRYLCPGLIDCHVHLIAAPGPSERRGLFDAHPDTIAYRAAWNARKMLLRGFTTVRDCCGASYALRDAIAEHLIPGPRVFISGKGLSQTGGHADLRPAHQQQCCPSHQPGFGRICDGVPACLEAARDELRQGADFLKIMASGGVVSPADSIEHLQFTAEEIQAITACARNVGKYVTAHAYRSEAIRHAVVNGCSGIEHANFIDVETARLCAERGVFVTPTLVTYQAFLRPPNDAFLDEVSRRKCQSIVDRGIDSLQVLKDAHVHVCFGTDLLGEMQKFQNEEFAIRSRIFSEIDLLRQATLTPAKLLGMAGQIGEISEGAFADLLILDANPLQRTSQGEVVLSRLEEYCVGIVKEGRVVMSRIEELKVDEVYCTLGGNV